MYAGEARPAHGSEGWSTSTKNPRSINRWSSNTPTGASGGVTAHPFAEAAFIAC
jgi:hypothetical protein